jgi:SAM-dependent methyltransferase
MLESKTMRQATSIYSRTFFETFADAIPAAFTAGDVAAAERLAPPGEFPRLLDIGCGTGRVTSGLADRGFLVTGVDANIDALLKAREVTPGGRFVALDYRNLAHMRWTFDVVTVYWNSIGFGTRADDAEVLRGVRRILRPGGRLLLELYHPDWLAAHELSGSADPRGAIVDRWVEDGRSCHCFRYANGAVDDIRFNIYGPEEIETLLNAAGLSVERWLVWWKDDQAPSGDHARYQVVADSR